jgi:hypothetical protein
MRPKDAAIAAHHHCSISSERRRTASQRTHALKEGFVSSGDLVGSNIVDCTQAFLIVGFPSLPAADLWNSHRLDER